MPSKQISKGLPIPRNPELLTDIIGHDIEPINVFLNVRRLDPRAPSVPHCVGDDETSSIPSPGAPDHVSKIFHPNEAGHATMASFALAEIVDLRAIVLGLTPDSCKKTDEWACWSDEGWLAYATASRLDETYRIFCHEVEIADGDATIRTFDKDTPDEHLYLIDLAPGAKFDKDKCKDSFSTIIHGCDTDSESNPMNWKGGGRWLRDENEYKLNIKRENRTPRPKKPFGHCEGWYKVTYSDYHIQGKHSSPINLQPTNRMCVGAGFISWDGKNDLWHAINDCAPGITHYYFKYFDEPDENGHEWESPFPHASLRQC